MSITHNFVHSNSIGGIGESIFYAVLSYLGTVKSVVSEKKWQKEGVDFILDDVKYDTKFDTKAFSTGNIALETVSRRKDGKVLKEGWVHQTGADCIAYMFLEDMHWSTYFFTPNEIKELAEEYKDNIKVIRNFGYESEVVLVPLTALEHKKKLRIPVVDGKPDLDLLKTVHNYLKSQKPDE